MSDLFGAPSPAEEPDNNLPVDADMTGGALDMPAASSAEGLQPEYANPVLLGHDKQQQALLNMWRSGKFPHAIAISGPKGVGKATLAFHLARYVLEHSADQTGSLTGGGQDALFGEGDAPAETLAIAPDSRSFTQVLSGGHPDILTIGDFYKGGEETDPNFKPAVDDIRRVPSFLQKTSAYGGWRVVIVDNADLMQTSAQNAILKVLEEPPSKALLILVVHREGAMLPTIKSRIRYLRCEALPRDVVKTLLMKDNPALDHDEADLLTLLANGSAGRALAYAREGGAETMPEVLSFLAGLDEMKASDILAFCEVMAQKSNESKLAQWRGILIWLLEAIIEAKARGSEPLAGLDLSGQLTLKMAMQNFMAKGSVQHWLNVLEQLKDHFFECDQRNLDAHHEVYAALRILKGDK